MKGSVQAAQGSVLNAGSLEGVVSVLAAPRLRLLHLGAIPPWRAARDPHECSREVRMVCKSGVLRNGCNSFLPIRELRAGPCGMTMHVLRHHRATESAPEQL